MRKEKSDPSLILFMCKHYIMRCSFIRNGQMDVFFRTDNSLRFKLQNVNDLSVGHSCGLNWQELNLLWHLIYP